MPRIVRTNKQAKLWMRDLSRRGATKLPPDQQRVAGHCVGAVGRAFTNGPAGFEDAHAMLDAVRQAGKLRRSKPRDGSIILLSGGKHGHVALASVRLGIVTAWGVDQPRHGRIGRVFLSVFRRAWGYKVEGWCWAEDVPGWR